jgi:hypothetical protein
MMKTNKITIIDEMMGGGKTTWAFDYINKADNETHFIFVTPFLKEIERCILETNKDFKQPEYQIGSKLSGLKSLLSNKTNIATTHSLFSVLDNEVLELLNKHNYILIMDEIHDVVSVLDFNLQDFQDLEGHYVIQDDHSIKWINYNYNGTFQKFKYMCINSKVFFINNIFLVWTFPLEIFNAFQETYILTYLFDAQIQKYYFDMHNVLYSKKSLDNNLKLIDYLERDNQRFKYLINIYKGNLNSIGEPRKNGYDRLSKTKMSKLNKSQLKPIKDNIYNYFTNITKAKSDDIIWTTFLPLKNKLKGNGYTKSFVPCNARATNEFGDRHNCAYILNRYMNQAIKAYFIDNNIAVDEDLYSLSELLQWLWRSAIRNGDEINLYIPSARMRGLLSDWLGK